MKVEKIPKILSEIKDRMDDSKISISCDLKIKIAKIMLDIMAARHKHFGLFIILGWQDKWNTYTDISDSGQDIFATHHINIMAKEKDEIATTVNFDGAILIDDKGNIKHSGIIIEGLRPSLVAQKINPGKFADLSEQFGFKEKVHSRHLSAITASYVFKNTTVYTVSEENDSFHVYEAGRILYSWDK